LTATGSQVLHPFEDRGVELNQRGVERVQLVFEAETVAAVHLTVEGEQLIERVRYNCQGRCSLA
jgi:hypothetical protein